MSRRHPIGVSLGLQLRHRESESRLVDLLAMERRFLVLPPSPSVLLRLPFLDPPLLLNRKSVKPTLPTLLKHSPPQPRQVGPFREGGVRDAHAPHEARERGVAPEGTEEVLPAAGEPDDVQVAVEEVGGARVPVARDEGACGDVVGVCEVDEGEDCQEDFGGEEGGRAWFGLWRRGEWLAAAALALVAIHLEGRCC